MSSDDFTDKIVEETKKLKRRTMAMADFIANEDKEVINELMEKTEENKERLSNNQNKIDNVVKSGRSFGWFDLIYLAVILYVVNYLVEIYIKLFRA